MTERAMRHTSVAHRATRPRIRAPRHHRSATRSTDRIGAEGRTPRSAPVRSPAIPTHRMTPHRSGRRRAQARSKGQPAGCVCRHSTHAGGSAPTAISRNGAYSVMPTPPKTMSSPGPPNVRPATVNSQPHSGRAASRGEDVHCSAAHTSTALISPLISALMGNGTEPMSQRQKERRCDGRQHPVDGEESEDDGAKRCRLGGRLSGRDAVEQCDQRADHPLEVVGSGPAGAAGWDPDPGPSPSLPPRAPIEPELTPSRIR